MSVDDKFPCSTVILDITKIIVPNSSNMSNKIKNTLKMSQAGNSNIDCYTIVVRFKSKYYSKNFFSTYSWIQSLYNCEISMDARLWLVIHTTITLCPKKLKFHVPMLRF